MSDWSALSLILVMALVTAALRFLPFLIFSKGRKVPEVVAYLGRVLPYAVMAMLVVYCMKGISFVKMPFGLPELISVVLVIVLHVWKRNSLLSIVGGTVCYMVLVQVVF